MESSRPLRSLARLLSDCAVKKLVGLSRAELTRLPVERRTWVCAMRSPVACKLRRFERTPADRTIPDMRRYLSGWPGLSNRSGSGGHLRNGVVKPIEEMW